MGLDLFSDAQHPSWTLAALAMASRASSTTDNPTSPLQQFGFALNFFFPSLALIIVGLRIYSRAQTKQLALDDALIIIAMVLSIGETATTYMYMKTNFIAIHAWNIPADYDAVQANIWNFAVQVLYNPILALVKTSMLLFLLKLGRQKPGVRWCIYALNTFNLSLMVAIFLVVIFQCKPIAYNWDHSIEGGTCIDQGSFYVATTALTLFTDVLTLAIPFWVFLDLKMPLRVKIVLFFVFLLGGIVTVVGIVRLWYIYTAFFKPPGSDPTYSLGFCTSGIETNLAIICASAPSLRGLVRSWFPRFFSSNRPSGNPYYEDRYRLGDSSNFNESNAAGGRRGGNGYGRGSKAAGSRIGHDGSRNMDGNTVVGESSSAGKSIALRDLKNKGGGMGISGHSTTHTAIGGGSPTASEEEIMSYNGIIRTTDVMVHYDDESQNARKDSIDSHHHSDRQSNSNSIGLGATVKESV
ncbi:cfem domain-containing protein [Ophiostoma piceae UAMH 11346]|uniref:Cfem domain-containing protein n=1 Tax=Ophiostoma piceae (strain UAMH 11346) TaxID=1262450 RepID=S3BWI1_OPHP1|nr:cfem domain-containing protein [Ophiostoma piceae UAMH 11346]